MRKKLSVASVFVFALIVSLTTTHAISGTTEKNSSVKLATQVSETLSDPSSDSSGTPAVAPTHIEENFFFSDKGVGNAVVPHEPVPSFLESEKKDILEPKILINQEEEKPESPVEVKPEPKPTPKPLCPQPPDASVSSDYMLLPMGPDFSIETFIPPGLERVPSTIDTRGRSLCLIPEALDALIAMYQDAQSDGLRLVPISGFRTFHTQAALKQREAGKNYTYPSIAEPGHSEHQLGTTVDFSSGTNANLKFNQFSQSPEYAWLRENAHAYGFVQSYQPGTEPITGYNAESWHWRYVGNDIASALKDNQTTLYEYLKGTQIGG